MKIRLFPKFLIAMSVVSLVPIILLGNRLMSMGQLGVKTAVLELHLNTADKIAGDFESFIDNFDKKAGFVIRALSRMDWENKQILLSSFVDANSDVKQVSVISDKGSEVIKVLGAAMESKRQLSNYSVDKYFLKVVKDKRRAVRFYSKGLSRDIAFYYPFMNNFVVRILIDSKQIFQEVEATKVGDTGFSLITDSSGSPVIYPKNAELDEKGLLRVGSWPIVEQALKSLSIGSLEYVDHSGEPFIGAYSPLPSVGGSVIVKQSRDEAYRYALFMNREAVYLIVFFVIMVFIAAFFMSRQLSGPIVSITKTAEYVAAGDFNHKVSISSRDELMDLAETFNRMIGQLKKYSDLQVDKIIKEQSKIEAILFSIEDGIIMTDYDGNVQLANRKARSVLGLKQKGSLEGKNLLGMIEDENVKEIISQVADNSKENFSKEIEIVLSQSTRFFKCFSLPVVTPKKNERMGLLIAIHDITLEKEILRIKDEFLHSITHDLRNPMGAIKGFVEFLLKELPGPITDAQRKMLISIDRASFRLLGMINNMLDIAKMEAGKMEIKIEKFSVGEMVQGVVDLMESLGKRKNIKFNISSSGDMEFDGDSGLIERVFINLLGNSIKFTPEDGVITLGFEDDGKNLVAYVQDTGDGIPSEYTDKVFEKFEQVKGQSAGGTGLGLTISKYVADAHLGKIWVESDIGKGAKFIFSLPKNLFKDENGNVVVSEEK